MKSDPIAYCILSLLDTRREGASICPSEVARALWPQDWRPHMQAVRDTAATMHEQSLIVVTQRGVPVDARLARGAIRLRKP